MNPVIPVQIHLAVALQQQQAFLFGGKARLGGQCSHNRCRRPAGGGEAPPKPIVRFASPISVGNLSPMRRAAQLVLQAARQAVGSAPALSSQPAPLVALRSATGERTNHVRAG